ncbi:MAG: energy-coupling factor ABC transporter ATP-binding protein [Chloroflexi bacterium]|nr:energy-coupling factor ABC transporter ATP-binding protein [Chloroflexota bacterium]MCL5274146.1 energy-coupling factor ABC transporter ATP-binding protein [Chloroflexota bacterium]
MGAAIVIKNLEWKYEHTTQFALRGVNLEVEENTFLGIVGANEQGKTTLINCICGLIPHSFNGVYRGSVEIYGKPVLKMSGLEIATQVGLVFADPEAQFTAMTVEEELVFGLENTGYDLGKIKERLDWAVDVTMIGDLLDKSPYDISGGQKQRMAIACVLAMNPPIIIMDEPTSMIDPLGKQFIFDILRKLKDAGDRTIIVVEHNIEQLAPLADQLLLMQGGQISKVAPPARFFDDLPMVVGSGAYPPEVTSFAYWLKQSGRLPQEHILPYRFEDGVDVARAAFNSARKTDEPIP